MSRELPISCYLRIVSVAFRGRRSATKLCYAFQEALFLSRLRHRISCSIIFLRSKLSARCHRICNDTLYFHSRCPLCTWFRLTKGRSWLDENSLWSIQLQLYSLSRFVRPRFTLGDRKSVEASPFESSFITRFKRLKCDIAEFAGCLLLKLRDIHLHVNCHERPTVSSILIRSDCTVCHRPSTARSNPSRSCKSSRNSQSNDRSERHVPFKIYQLNPRVILHGRNACLFQVNTKSADWSTRIRGQRERYIRTLVEKVMSNEKIDSATNATFRRASRVNNHR